MEGNNKVLGLESAVYVKLCYILILVSGALGLLLSLLGTIGLVIASTSLISLVGLAGLIMALVGWLAFAKDFTVIELSHLKFLSVVFVAFYIASLILGSILYGASLLWSLLSLILGATLLLVVYLGFRLWQARQEPTQVTLKMEFDNLKASLKNRGNL